jgi:hypothetical protein
MAIASGSQNLKSYFDNDDNMYVNDLMYRIRRIAPNGTVLVLVGSTYDDGHATSARFSYPRGISTSENTLFVCDRFNNRIRGLYLNGTVFTYAGNGTASSIDGVGQGASFNRPYGITADSRGVLCVAASYAVRAAYLNRTVATLAGSSASGCVDGQVRSARFNYPLVIATFS